jgi:ribonuclease T1
MSRFKNLKLVLAGLCVAATVMSGALFAKTPPSVNLQTTISLGELPKQGVQIYTLIHQGGPFATEKDGVVFGNRERLLPLKKRGYYLEYTVPTPGLSHRGVKRIVCGGRRTEPDICYYTADHYETFRKILP